MPTASDFRTKAAQLETPALALYQQVKDYIARKIQEGIVEGGRPPALRERTGHPVRHLAHDGEPRTARAGGAGAHRARGRCGQLRGRRKAPIHAAADRQFGEEITQRGHDHRFELISMRRASASPEVAAALDLAVGASVFHLQGVHFENEVPVQLEDRYVNPRLVPDFMEQDFSAVQPSVYLVRNVQYDQIEHVVDAILPTAEQAHWLQMAADQPCLMLTRRTWLRGVPITWVHCVHPGMRYRLGSRFRTDPVHGG